VPLRKLYISQFRNHSFKEVKFPPGSSALTGNNGSGKTAILEAARYLSVGRSYRSRYDHEVIKWGQNNFTVRGEFEDAPVESIAIRYHYSSTNRGQKQVYVDDEQLTRLSKLQGLFPTVINYPELTRLLTGSPAGRREFMNALLGQISLDYIDNLKSYKQALNQRNSLLKQSQPDELLLAQYEERLATSAKIIREQRNQLLNWLEKRLIKEQEFLAADLLPELSLVYDAGLDEKDIRLQFERERPKAMRRSYTTIGVQRDDWKLVDSSGRELKEFASRGELKLILAALKFVEARFLEEKTGRRPTFLVDDFSAELDVRHQKKVLSRNRELNYQFLCSGVKMASEVSVNQVIKVEDFNGR